MPSPRQGQGRSGRGDEGAKDEGGLGICVSLELAAAGLCSKEKRKVGLVTENILADVGEGGVV